MRKLSLIASVLAITSLALVRPVSSQFPSTIDLGVDSASVTISGAATNDLTGYSLATGDIDGDGVLELIVIAMNADPLGEYDIIWGWQLAQPLTLNLASPAAPVGRIFGEASSPLNSEVTTGDFNDDGYDDILLGQPLAHPNGRAYLILGSPTFPDTFDLAAESELVKKLYGESFSSGQLGDGVCACDMNGDGYDEAIISAPAMYVAEAYIVWGSDSLPDSVSMDVQVDGVTRIIDNKVQHALGRGLACEDINGDGYDDLAIGASGVFIDDVGAVSIIYGQSTLPDTIMIAGSGATQKHILAENPSDVFGDRLAIGDIGADGKLDIAISADGADPFGCSNCGAVYVIHDGDDLPDSTVVNATSHPISRIIGGGGAMVRNLGNQLHVSDLSGDGADDIVISARKILSNPTSSDKTFVVYGGGLPDSIFLDSDTNTTCITPEFADDHLGQGLASGDFNGDGIEDLAAGATWHDPPGRPNAGSAYVFYGRSTATTVGPNSPRVSFFYNRPNPFSSSTVFEYELLVRSPVTIRIYNVLGQLVGDVVSLPLHGPGRFAVPWNGNGNSGARMPSGVYFYRIETGNRSYTKKLTILR